MSNEEVYHHSPKIDESSTAVAVEAVDESKPVEHSDRGLFDFMKKKKEEPEKCDENVISSEFEEKVNVSEPEPVVEEKHETLLQKIHQSHGGSSSSSSSDEECEDGEKKKKQKPLKQVIKEKIDDYEEKKEVEKIEKQKEDTYVPVEKYEEEKVPQVVLPAHGLEQEEKKGFLEKIKEKLPGGHKTVEEEHVAPPQPTPVAASYDGLEDPKEKKGIFEKIKEKIPGHHSKSEEEKEKEKVKECD